MNWLGYSRRTNSPSTRPIRTVLTDGARVYGQVRQADVPTPSRGMTMRAVEERFGAPEARSPAVGQPPITRWDYPGYSVFFEHDRVLHTVVPVEEGPTLYEMKAETMAAIQNMTTEEALAFMSQPVAH